MSNEMIERVARVLWDDIGSECGQEDCRWLQNIEKCYCQEGAFRLAKVAIAAMREPTEKMILASGLCTDVTGVEEAYEWYKAMIDAALKE